MTGFLHFLKPAFRQASIGPSPSFNDLSLGTEADGEFVLLRNACATLVRGMHSHLATAITDDTFFAFAAATATYDMPQQTCSEQPDLRRVSSEGTPCRVLSRTTRFALQLRLVKGAWL